ncbi:VOC family protein [Mycoplasmatota bacterium]|nr:VOC family protein [Mycoplasmatota bacterium]
MARITGIGGVFLNITDSNKLLRWYKDILNLDITEHGINFLEPNKLTLLTFNNKNKTILNFTVDNLELFLEELRSKDVKIVKEISTFKYGKFIQIEDILGNVIELWEPFEEEYKKMVKKEIADFKKKT